MSNRFTPFRDEEFRDFRPRGREPDYPPIPDIEYCRGPDDVGPRAGGFGFVYKARHIKLGRKIAVKVAHRRAASDDEVLTLAEFQHPNIVTIHHTDLTSDGRRYFFTEWLAGGGLDDWLRANVCLSPRLWAEMFETIARALDVTHVAGFLHRDIKPGNIFFVDAERDWFRRPKLGDFGLAVRGTKGPANGGTPGYQAPELHKDYGNSTRFSDMYSLGVTMWQCLGGGLPIEGTLTLPLPRILRVPRTLEAIVSKCISHADQDRYGLREINIEDERQRPASRLAEDLRAFLEHRPTMARPLNTVQAVGLWSRARHGRREPLRPSPSA